VAFPSDVSSDDATLMLPRGIAYRAVHPRFRVPHHAEVLLAVVVGMLILVTTCAGRSASHPSVS